jgi:hypothetical protein
VTSDEALNPDASRATSPHHGHPSRRGRAAGWIAFASSLLLAAGALPHPTRADGAHGGGLRLGFAKRAITPTLGARPVFMAGFGHDRRASGVHDDLWARAVAASDGTRRVVVVSVDLIGLFLADVEKARGLLRARVGDAALVVSSTHDHEGPDTMGLWGRSRFSSGVDPAYLDRVRRAVVDAAADALSRLEPARLVLAMTHTPGLIVDSRLPVVIDDTLVALQAIGAGGRTLGTVVSWGSHPEALGGRNTLVTADYPHFLTQRLEEELGGTAVFLVGSIGGLMTPLGLELRSEGGQPVPADSFELARAVGERAAAAAVRALHESGRDSVSTTVEYRRARTDLPLENRLFRLAAFFGVLDRPFFSKGAPASTLFGDDVRTEVGWLRIGDAEALCVPGEIYPELVVGGVQDPQDPGADFPGAPREVPLKDLLSSEYRFVIGLANDEIGYIIPRSEWDARAPYAYGREDAQYGEVNSVGPGVAHRLADAFAVLLARPAESPEPGPAQ